jgi:hypothetical protein
VPVVALALLGLCLVVPAQAQQGPEPLGCEVIYETEMAPPEGTVPQWRHVRQRYVIERCRWYYGIGVRITGQLCVDLAEHGTECLGQPSEVARFVWHRQELCASAGEVSQ